MTFGPAHPSSQSPESVANLVFRMIAKTATGRRVMEKFLPAYTAKRITIESYPSTVLEQLRAVLGEGTPIGACFTIDNGIGRIFIDTTSPLGVLAPFLLHEMVHALDERLWDADGQAMKRSDRDALFLKVELKAFQAQHQVIEELKERFEGYEKFLREYYPKAKILHEKLTEQSIADLYGFRKSA